MTERRAAQFCRQFEKLRKKGVKVRINTRLPYDHDTTILQIQGWQAAKLLKSHGVKVCFYHDMRHRKLAIIDDNILWEGSLNILSQSSSREVMRRTVSSSLCKQMLKFTGMGRWKW
jgi:phosphatidylserine/phosphatidylglycerophosphate/cardiolipin synthase-like enzyme